MFGLRFGYSRSVLLRKLWYHVGILIVCEEDVMPDLDPTPAEWRQLYAAATEIMRTAPWQWMTEDRLFGVQNPETGEIGFVSVMGHLGEHLAVAVYRGPRALYDFMALHYSPDSAKPERIIEMEQLQAVFADRDELTDRDRRLSRPPADQRAGSQISRTPGLALFSQPPARTLAMVPGSSRGKVPGPCPRAGNIRCAAFA